MAHKIVRKTVEYVLSNIDTQQPEEEKVSKICTLILDAVHKNATSFSMKKQKQMCMDIFDCVCHDLKLSNVSMYTHGEAIICEWFIYNTSTRCCFF